MKSLGILLFCFCVSFYYTDLESASGFRSLFLPIVDFVLLCGLALWVAGRTGTKSISSPNSSSFLGFFDGGGDGGGCD